MHNLLLYYPNKIFVVRYCIHHKEILRCTIFIEYFQDIVEQIAYINIDVALAVRRM
jgi:hypothetical protein